MKRNLLIMAFALGGCVPVSSGGIYRTPIDAMVESAKAPKDFAQCAAQAFQGNNPISNDGDHYWVTRTGHQGQPFARWDFLPAPGGGSVAHLRSVLLMGSAGDDKVRSCA